MSRAIRRHHYARLKETRKHYWGYGWHTRYQRGNMSPVAFGKVTRTPQPCSLSCCGNQRRAWGKKTPTMQERRFFCDNE